jgi:hypothetical protein
LQKKTPFTRHQVKAWREAKGVNVWKEYEEHIDPLNKHGVRRYVNEDDISCSNIVQATLDNTKSKG